jgi:hypothetical protein
MINAIILSFRQEQLEIDLLPLITRQKSLEIYTAESGSSLAFQLFFF